MDRPEDAPPGLLPALYQGTASIEVGGRRLAGDELAAAVGGVARLVAGVRRVAVVAHPALGTLVAVAGILAAGGTVIPLNPSAAGRLHREHVLHDAQADLVLDDIDLAIRDSLPAEPPADGRPAFILYTSGSTGPPKGAVIPRRAVAANLDAIAGLWEWTAEDVLAHALPFSHVHGLVFGGIGPLRIGSPLVHGGRYLVPVPSASIYFGVPSVWSSLSTADLRALSGARLLVSGADALSPQLFTRVAQHSGHRLLNRYAMTETLVITSPHVKDERVPGSVGPPVPGVEVRLAEVGEAGDGELAVVPGDRPLTEVHVRGPGLFSGYLGGGPALDDDGWFATGDLGEWRPDGSLRLTGRKSTDLIKSGGYRVGAGEVEDALRSFPGIAEAAVTGLPDDRLGQRVAAWVVTTAPLDRARLQSFLAARLVPYKQPQEIHVIDALPRNALGKVQKKLLTAGRRR